MKRNGKVYIHIGMEKTGTTFLQHNLFPNLKINLLKTFLDLSEARGSNFPFLISNEGLCGPVYKKGGMFSNFSRSVLAIKDLFVSPNIILCFREPSDYLLSSYKQYLHEGGVLTFDRFFSLQQSALVNRSDLFFSKYIQFLKSEFDPESLFVYNFDSFRMDPLKVIDAIIAFLNHDDIEFDIALTRKRANPSVPYHYESTLRFLNSMDQGLKRRTGLRMRLQLFGKLLSPRTFCQYMLPAIYRPRGDRDVSDIKDYYLSDWENVLNQLDI